MWPLARQRQTWHEMLLSCVQGMLFPLRKSSRLVCIPAHTAGASLQASGAGLAKARAAVVRQLWTRMPSDVHMHIYVSSELCKGFCRQFARCTMMLGLRLQVCRCDSRSIQNSPSRSPEGEKQLRAQIRGHLMREAHCYCHCDSKAAPRARHPAADHRVGSCRHGFHRGSLDKLLLPVLKSRRRNALHNWYKEPLQKKYDAGGDKNLKSWTVAVYAWNAIFIFTTWSHSNFYHGDALLSPIH